jgi:hypothetical protein
MGLGPSVAVRKGLFQLPLPAAGGLAIFVASWFVADTSAWPLSHGIMSMCVTVSKFFL